jgi:hypothetical protein
MYHTLAGSNPLFYCILRNCAFHVKGHRALLTPEDTKVSVPPADDVEAPGIDVLPYILLPLAGPEEFDLEVNLNVHFWHYISF